MARRKCVAAKPDVVQLSLSAPNSILPFPMPIIIETQTDRTWLELLNEDLGLEVLPESGMCIRSLGYSNNSTGNTKMWQSELHNKISEFVDKFCYKMTKYRARLVLRHSNTKHLSMTKNSGTKSGQIRKERVSRNSATIRKPGIVIQTQVTSSNNGIIRKPGRDNAKLGSRPLKLVRPLRKMKGLQNVEPLQQQTKAHDLCARPVGTQVGPTRSGEGLSVIKREPSVELDWEVNWDEPVEPVGEEEDTNGDGMQMEDIKPLIERRMSRFSNAYLLRMKNEIQTLQDNNLWVRNVARSPLACYWLQEMFTG